MHLLCKYKNMAQHLPFSRKTPICVFLFCFVFLMTFCIGAKSRDLEPTDIYWDFPSGSDGKASTYNAGDPGSIPGSGRSPGEGNGNPLQYSCLENPMDGGTFLHILWASLVAQTVKNLPVMQETQVQSRDREAPMEKGMATHSSILPWRIPWTEEPGGLQSMKLQRVTHNLANEHACAHT